MEGCLQLLCFLHNSPVHSPSFIAEFLSFSSSPFLFSATTALDITEVINGYQDYSTFNNYPTQTQIANAINSRQNQTLTELVVNNGNMGVVSGLPMDTLKSLLTLHVLFDYFDLQKLKNLPNNTVHVTTLYQTSDQATNQRGFLNATISGNGDVAFMSAASGSSVNSKVIKNVYAQPCNFSVLEISNLITPPGLTGGNSSSNSSVCSPAPTNSTPASSPIKSPTPPISPVASYSSAPAPSRETITPPDAPSGKSSAAAIGGFGDQVCHFRCGVGICLVLGGKRKLRDGK
ncbi:hypothetical protein SLEP1_g6420 [Rubroshorea leprosula]|uniref:FAS1 domain-containing protein n=1 Tax=Rubroshorea leprosula TaxID=152421 RepID=A0AAV5I3D5_9ROSI|nr:hypothetical protein SLEP1_g6420 [Rubroshorea leprosula]